jgi:phospholipid N-methyltransferase
VPYSSSAFNYWVSEMLKLLQPAKVLDIGPGAGKYGVIVRKVASENSFDSHTTAVEIDETYVEEFGLREIYDEVIVDDALNLIHKPQSRFDLVIIGDCIEHLRKSAGMDLLNFLIYRTGYICVVYPDQFVQDDWEGHAAEAHISTWSLADFAGWDVLHHSWDGMHMFLIKGFQPSRMRITG